MSPSIRNQAKLAGVALAAGLALTAFGAGDAWAQAQNVRTFDCLADFDISLSASGLGNQNICAEITANVELQCACSNKGGNCTSDANKNNADTTVTASVTVEPKNGGVGIPNAKTLDLGFEFDDDTCVEEGVLESCPSGQFVTLISWFALQPTTAVLCETDAATGEPCSCAGEEILATDVCPTSGEDVFPGKKDSCLALFP